MLLTGLTSCVHGRVMFWSTGRFIDMANGLPLDTILEGDCCQVLKGFPERSIDLVFADPPYNLQLRQELHRPNQSRVDAVDDPWDHFASFEEYDTFSAEWLTACRRVLKDTGTLWVIGMYHNIYRIGKTLQDMDFWILNDVVWIKNNPMPNFRGVRFTNAHETLLWAQKKRGARYTFNHQSMKALNDDLQIRSDWYLPLCTGGERCKVDGNKAHATQKPESLLYRILLASTNPGDVVLDPFFGTGTTGAVAKKLGRHYIGIERDPDYIHTARERIAEVTPAPAAALNLPEPRSKTRIPFGRLVEYGLLQPGQRLFFSKDITITASILANAHLDCNGVTGSIHGIARSLLKNTPANGWECWLTEKGGILVPIDHLRQEYIKTMEKNAQNP